MKIRVFLLGVLMASLMPVTAIATGQADLDECRLTASDNGDAAARTIRDSVRKNMARYPPEALRAGIEGKVLLTIQVDAQGTPTRIEVGTSSGSDALDRAALDAAHNWRFCPAIQDGQPVPGEFHTPVEFSMQ